MSLKIPTHYFCIQKFGSALLSGIGKCGEKHGAGTEMYQK